MRQIQNECQDLRFLVDQKDIRIRKQDQELTKMKGKYEKILAKMYISSQDEVIEGLAPNITERDEINVLMKGHQQEFQLSSPLKKFNNDISELVHDDSFQLQDKLNFKTQHTSNDAQNNKKWADELTKADERCQLLQAQLEDARKKKADVEVKLETLEKQVDIREQEIQRLHTLYEGGQNLERLNIRFVHETNEKTIAKLQNQLEFVNKENHRLTQ